MSSEENPESPEKAELTEEEMREHSEAAETLVKMTEGRVAFVAMVLGRQLYYLAEHHMRQLCSDRYPNLAHLPLVMRGSVATATAKPTTLEDLQQSLVTQAIPYVAGRLRQYHEEQTEAGRAERAEADKLRLEKPVAGENFVFERKTVTLLHGPAEAVDFALLEIMRQFPTLDDGNPSYRCLRLCGPNCRLRGPVVAPRWVSLPHNLWKGVADTGEKFKDWLLTQLDKYPICPLDLLIVDDASLLQGSSYVGRPKEQCAAAANKFLNRAAQEHGFAVVAGGPGFDEKLPKDLQEYTRVLSAALTSTDMAGSDLLLRIDGKLFPVPDLGDRLAQRPPEILLP